MKTLRFLFIVIALLPARSTAAQSEPKFKIVFTAAISNIDTAWLSAIKGRWKGTGVCIRVLWGEIETQPNQFTWTNLDQAISAVSSKGLDVYIRVSMGVMKPAWVIPGSNGLDTNDFQVRRNGTIFSYGTDPSRKHPLNFGSSVSINYLSRFYSAVLQHLHNQYPTIIKEIVPSVSVFEEMEYPSTEICGYSLPEITKFTQSLQLKYNSINNLNSRWGSSFQSFSQINPRSFDWDNLTPYVYQYPAGRVDWIQWRTSLLKKFVDSCAIVTQWSSPLA